MTRDTLVSALTLTEGRSSQPVSGTPVTIDLALIWDGWMDGCMDGRADGGTGRQTDECVMDRQMDGRIDEWTDKKKKKRQLNRKTSQLAKLMK